MNKYVLIFDSYLGKGFFWIFWGFLLFNKNDAAFSTLAVVYLASGVVFIVAGCTGVGPIHHLTGNRPSGSDVAGPGVSRAPGRGNSVLPPDTYLASAAGAAAQHPGAAEAATSWATAGP